MREFTLTQFALHLGELGLQYELTAHSALEQACRIIEAKAKDAIGHYQPAAGSFSAWAPLADATVADRVAQGYSPDEPLLRTGDLRDSIGHEVDGYEAIVGSKSQIAVWQELGTSRIPPRPFLGPAALNSRAQVEKAIGEIAVHGLLYGAAGAWTPIGDYA